MIEKKLHSLTNPQKSIYLTEKYYSGTAVNTICGYVFISQTSTNLEILKNAINEVVKNNDGMRLRLEENDTSCVQYIEKYLPFDIDILNFSCKEDIETTALKMANTSFKLTNSPLFHFILFKLPDGSGGFIVNVHHLIR